MSFKITDKQFLKKCKQRWKRVEKLLKIEFASKPVYSDDDDDDDDDKYTKTKMIIYDGGMIPNFQSKKMPKEKALCKCLSIIMQDSVIKATKMYYPQTLLEECKYEQ